ncbi:alpha/beta hydrolase [Neobacillus mesonae]|nr:alpha/beta hydrolase [Neobacillus mesonae]
MTSIPISEKYMRTCASVIGLPFTLYQSVLTKLESRQLTPPGDFVQIGERSLHTVVTGKGDYTIILEAGMGGCSLDWSLVQPELSKHATVLSYDRSGFGWSRGTLQRPTCRQYVEDLRAILSAKKLKPPYILVGHSYGGMMMRLFASMYPEEVSGLLLVDSSHEGRYLDADLKECRTQERLQHFKQHRLGYLLSPLAVPRLVKQHIGSKRLPSPMNQQTVALGYRSAAFQSAYLELRFATESAIQMVNAPPLRPSMPVIVLTAGKQSEEWKESQKALFELTNCTIPLTVQESYHSIQIHQPEAVIDSALSLRELSHG